MAVSPAAGTICHDCTDSTRDHRIERKKLKALQKWRRDLKNELVPELLRAHDANRAEIAKKIVLYVGFDHPWKIY